MGYLCQGLDVEELSRVVLDAGDHEDGDGVTLFFDQADRVFFSNETFTLFFLQLLHILSVDMGLTGRGLRRMRLDSGLSPCIDICDLTAYCFVVVVCR